MRENRRERRWLWRERRQRTDWERESGRPGEENTFIVCLAILSLQKEWYCVIPLMYIFFRELDEGEGDSEDDEENGLLHTDDFGLTKEERAASRSDRWFGSVRSSLESLSVRQLNF